MSEPRISIAALIYRSTKFADSVWESAHEHTPELATGEAEFYFVANDATWTVKKHLSGGQHGDGRRFKHFVQDNRRYTEIELFNWGYAAPEYISRVYRGWNRAILESAEICVLVNSDHVFSPGWLTPLVRALDENPRRLVCSQAIELPGFGGAWPVDFGRTLSTFRKQEFLDYAREHAQAGVIRPGGVFMPVAFKRRLAIEAGLYPEGNLHAGRYDKVRKYGDAEFFDRMR
jgi:hypothetical protein